jgi:hypothetical protein
MLRISSCSVGEVVLRLPTLQKRHFVCTTKYARGMGYVNDSRTFLDWKFTLGYMQMKRIEPSQYIGLTYSKIYGRDPFLVEGLTPLITST